MNDRVIYFPYMNVPKSEWFSKVLLYWDEVASIIPYEFLHRPDKLDEHMQELLKEDLVKQISPGGYIYEIPNFSNAFLELIDKDPIIQKRRRVPLTSEIHLEKLSNIGEELVRRNLAYRPKRYEPWFRVESRTAGLFMTYLASVLGKLDNLQMTPITDKTSLLSEFSGSPVWQNNKPPRSSRIRMSILNEILPIPSAKISVYELIKFKRQNQELLIQFRRYVETFLIEVSDISDAELQSERVDYFKADVKDQIDEIVRRMSEKRWPKIVFGGISGVLAGALPVAAGISLGDPITALAGLPGLITAVYTAYDTLPKSDEPVPLAYAALAKKTFSQRL